MKINTEEAELLKYNPKYHIEQVLFSKILIKQAALHKYGEFNLQPASWNEPPRLIKHKDGLYHVYDGVKRLYWIFKDNCEDKSLYPHSSTVYCLVQNELSNDSSSGYFIWQIADYIKEVKRSTSKRLLDWAFGRSRFKLINNAGHFFLSRKTRKVLDQVEDILAELYSTYKSRLYDLQALAKIEDYSSKDNRLEISQRIIKHLKQYLKPINKLTAKDIQLENQTISLLELLAILLEKELGKSNIEEKYQAKIKQLKEILIGNSQKEGGILQSLQIQLNLIESKKLPEIKNQLQTIKYQLQEIIIFEEDFMRQFQTDTHFE